MFPSPSVVQVILAGEKSALVGSPPPKVGRLTYILSPGENCKALGLQVTCKDKDCLDLSKKSFAKRFAASTSVVKGRFMFWKIC